MNPTKPRTLDSLRPVTEHPAVQATRANLDRLLGQLREAEQRERAFERGMAEARDGAHPHRITAHAAAFLEGREPDVGSTGDVEARRELGRRRDRRRALQEAVQLAQRALEEARSRASAEACAALAATYGTLVDRQTAAIVEFSRAAAALEDFQTALERLGYHFPAGAVRPMRQHWPGRLEDPMSTARVYLRECAEYGFTVPAMPEIDTGEQARKDAEANVQQLRTATAATRPAAATTPTKRSRSLLGRMIG